MAAPVFDSAASASITGETLAWNHTCTGSDLYLVVGLFIRLASGGGISGLAVTYNSVAMSLLTSVDDGTSVLYLYGLKNPSTGTNSVSASWTTARTSIGASVSATGVLSGIGATNVANGTTQDATLNISAGPDDLVVDVVKSFRNTTPAPTHAAGGGQTEDTTDTWATTISGRISASHEAGGVGGTTTMSWTLTNNTFWYQCAVVLHGTIPAQGSVSVSGALAKRTQMPLSGNVSTITGALTSQLKKNVSVGGGVSVTGTLSKIVMEAAKYPNVLPILVVHGAGTEYPKSSDRNAPNREIEAIATELGTNPKTITDATSPSASPASVASYLDMMATILKAMAGSTNWYGGAVPIRKIGWGNGRGGTVAAAGTSYVRMFTRGISTTENTSRCIIPYAATIKNLYVKTTTAQPGTGSLVFNFLVNSVDDAGLTLTIPASSAAGVYSTTGTVQIRPGVTLVIKIVNNAPATASAGISGVTFEMDQVG